MASLYTKAADWKRLSRGAIGMLERTPAEHSNPSPSEKVRESGRKSPHIQIVKK
jgi:hypothetical protein